MTLTGQQMPANAKQCPSEHGPQAHSDLEEFAGVLP